MGAWPPPTDLVWCLPCILGRCTTSSMWITSLTTYRCVHIDCNCGMMMPSKILRAKNTHRHPPTHIQLLQGCAVATHPLTHPVSFVVCWVVVCDSFSCATVWFFDRVGEWVCFSSPFEPKNVLIIPRCSLLLSSQNGVWPHSTGAATARSFLVKCCYAFVSSYHDVVDVLTAL